MSGRGNVKDAALVLGGSPRVSLLPPEVKQRDKDKRTRRGAVGLILLALAISALSTAGAMLYALNQQAALEAAQQRTTMLLAEQKQFAEVRTTMNALASAERARLVGVSTEIDWKSWNASAVSTLPAGARVTSLVVDSGTPIELHPPAAVPLQGERVGVATYEIATAALGDLPIWLDALPAVPGYVDAIPSPIALSSTGEYVSTVTIHFNASAYTLRFEGK